MVKMKLLTLARLSLALALFSCAAPKKAIVVQPAPADPKKDTTQTAGTPVPNLPGGPDDGIRLPDMLAMPGEGDFRPTAPPSNKTNPDTGAVIARPPTDPPTRPKPQDKEKDKEKDLKGP